MWVILAAAGLCTLTDCQRRQDEIILQLKHEPGVRTSHMQITRGSVRVTRNDSLLSNDYVEARTDIDHTVLSVDPADSVARVEVAISSGMPAPQANDTAGAEADSAALACRRVVKYVQYIRPNGQLVNIEFGDESGTSRPAYIKQYYEQAFPVFPKQPVAVGYEWTQTTRVSLPEGPVDASTKYTVKSFVRERGYNCAVVEYTGQCVIPLEVPLPDSAAGVWLVNGVDRIQSDGVIYFAYEDGFAVLERERWSLTGNRVQATKNADTLRTKVEVDQDVDISLLLRTSVTADTASGQ